MQRAGLILGGANLFADVEHRRLVALALADDDGAVDGDGIQAIVACSRRPRWSAPSRSPMPMVRAEAMAASSTTRKHFQREIEHGTFSPHGRYHSFGAAPIQRNRNWRCWKSFRRTPPLAVGLDAAGIRANRRPGERDFELGTASARCSSEVWRMAPRVRWVHSRSAGLGQRAVFRRWSRVRRSLTNGRGVFTPGAGGICNRARFCISHAISRRMIRSQRRRSGNLFDCRSTQPDARNHRLRRYWASGGAREPGRWGCALWRCASVRSFRAAILMPSRFLPLTANWNCWRSRIT